MRGSSAHLAVEGYGPLIKSLLLRIPNVAGDDPVERQTVVFLLELVAVLLRLDGELTADGVLDVANGGIERVDGEVRHDWR